MDELAALKDQIKALTKLCAALHRRLGGGSVILPMVEYASFTGNEDISIQENPHGKGYVVEVSKK